MSRWVTLATAGLLCAGCASNQNPDDEFLGLGRVGASSEPPPGVSRPLVEGDLAGLAERGALLAAMERALRLGYEQGAYAVGVGEGDIVLPLVDVDPGGRSAQVLFLRWRRDQVGLSGDLHPKYAERWLLVSMMLEPERVLDKELLAGTVEEDSVEFHRAAALLAAAQRLRTQTPEEAYHLFTVPELTPTQSRRTPTMVATRVYAMSARGGGPDVEVLVDEANKGRIPEVLDATVVHEAGAVGDALIRVQSPQPAAASVARVMLQDGSGSVEVESSAGAWLVDRRTGRVSRP
ncbi:MAG: hypothetical protein AAGA54_21035 [Myxococcota bacterium]